MRTIYTWLIPGMWAAWTLCWCIGAFTAKPVLRRESMTSRLSHILPLCAAVALLVPSRFPNVILSEHFLPWTPTGFWTGAALIAAGLSFSAAARWSLGGNWSGTVTLKQDHTLTRVGPYRYVRHPIYTGLLVAVLGSAITEGEWRGLLALALIVFAFLRKIQIEERFMLERFGDTYARYRQEVAALVPWVI
jgi:protein-S-isoprenylcysteine O-methyltransferase Ste14